MHDRGGWDRKHESHTRTRGRMTDYWLGPTIRGQMEPPAGDAGAAVEGTLGDGRDWLPRPTEKYEHIAPAA